MPGQLAEPTAAEVKRVKTLQKMLQRAEEDRNRHKRRIEICYKFGMPWRHRFDSSQPDVSQIDEIFTSIVMTVLEDFAASMHNTFTPTKVAWVEFKPVEQFGETDLAELKAPLEKYGSVIFSEMRRSNVFQALQEAYLDLGPGTMSLCIDDINSAEPIHCEAIPATELLLNKGPYGAVQGIHRKWPKMCGHEIGVLWPEAKGDKPNAFAPDDMAEYEVVDGVSRDWSKPAEEKWEYNVLVGGRLAYSKDYTGRGSNPMIVARWSRDSTTAWGVGPTYRVTPAIKELNYLEEKKLKAIDKTIDPAVSFPDDGVINIEQGVTPGMWIPRAQGSDAPEAIESHAKLEPAFLEVENLIHEIKRAHYQDEPEQAGKTPPTATQWMDETAKTARRMGTPATNMVHELVYAIVYRFAYLLEKRGKLPKVQLNGNEIALEPVSPLLRAQEQEEVVRMQRFGEIITAMYGPELTAAITKPIKFAGRIANKMGIPADVLNSEAELQAAMQQAAQAAQAAGMTGGGGGGQPA
jgi:hypothetical protein